jgi:phosphoribosylglycinamide formyltransferase-1
MRLLTPAFVGRWDGRMLNIHPALLPAFKGLDTHARALAAGVKLHGATVHFVVPEMDSGPVVAQGAVAVREDDTERSLAARVLAVEHRIYPLALRWLAEGRLRVEGGRCLAAGALAPGETLIAPVENPITSR